jgi:hypothetical protein
MVSLGAAASVGAGPTMKTIASATASVVRGLMGTATRSAGRVPTRPAAIGFMMPTEPSAIEATPEEGFELFEHARNTAMMPPTMRPPMAAPTAAPTRDEEEEEDEPESVAAEPPPFAGTGACCCCCCCAGVSTVKSWARAVVLRETLVDVAVPMADTIWERAAPLDEDGFAAAAVTRDWKELAVAGGARTSRSAITPTASDSTRAAGAPASEAD